MKTGYSTPLLAFVYLGRPHFLVGGFVFYGLGVAMARYSGAPFDLPAYLAGQLAVTLIQLMTHYANEYFDLDADRANTTATRWAGGSRVLPEGHLAPRVALITALTLAVLALGVSVLLVAFIRPGPPTLVMLLIAIALAWSYSSPPLRLHSRGLGELTTALLVAVMTPLVAFYLQSGVIFRTPILATVPLAALQFAMLLVIEFPDADSDHVAGKHTLVVRLGAGAAAQLHNSVLLFAYVLVPTLLVVGLPAEVALAVAVGGPLAGWQVWRMARGAWSQPALWDSLAFVSVALVIGTATFEVFAFAALAGSSVLATGP